MYIRVRQKFENAFTSLILHYNKYLAHFGMLSFIEIQSCSFHRLLYFYNTTQMMGSLKYTIKHGITKLEYDIFKLPSLTKVLQDKKIVLNHYSFNI